MNKQKSEALVMWAIAVLIGAVLFAVKCHGQTNVATNAVSVVSTNAYVLIHTSNGDITIPLSAAFGSILATLAGFAWVARIVLRFLPAAKDGSVLAWVVGFLKVLGATTPEKHQADVSVTAPTDNGLTPGTALSPKTPVEVPVSEKPTPNGL